MEGQSSMGFFGYVGKIFGYNGSVKEQNLRIIDLEKNVEDLVVQTKSLRVQLDQLTATLSHLTIAHMQMVNDMGMIYSSLKAIVEDVDQDPFSQSMLHYGIDDDDDPLPN
jgi:hypothetical protein